MDMWNMVNYLYNEQAALKAKYDNLTSLVREILEAVKNEEVKRLEKENKKSHFVCRYFRRGYCKEGQSCQYFHPNEVCQEYFCTGSCSQGKRCRQRHPQKCRYWMRGHCWRGELCVYLHKDVDKDEDLRRETNEDEATFEDENKDEGSKKETNEDEATSEEEINRNVEQSSDPLDDSLGELTAEEIIKMYENVEITLDDGDQISTDEILRMYAESSEKLCPIKKSTRKIKQKKIS
jgi:hypothetical protein